MKIKKDINVMSFGEAPIGSVFKEAADDQYYIKIQKILIEDGYGKNFFSAVNLENGLFEFFLPEDEIVLCPNATLVP